MQGIIACRIRSVGAYTVSDNACMKQALATQDLIDHSSVTHTFCTMLMTEYVSTLKTTVFMSYFCHIAGMPS